MRPIFHRARRLLAPRRTFVAACVVAHLASTFGFPVSPAPTKATASRPFPCQHHRCGCASADQCWRSCCCMSTREKLAWARAHGVTPPDFVVGDARLDEPSFAVAEGHAPDSPGNACCSKSKRNPSKSSCCKRMPATERVEWVLGMQAQKCRGLATFWLSCGAALPPPTSIAVPEDPTPPVWCKPLLTNTWAVVFQRPEVPPPRCA